VELETNAVHAVAFISRRVKLLPFENMAKMTSTVGASDFDSGHAPRFILVLNDSTGNSIEEGWPPTSTGELGG
jgi:hypothetical protein